MARFFTPKYHDDEIKKRAITEEDIRFLKDLQKEMNTQDTMGQGAPRYWVIRDYEKIYGADLNSPDGYILFDTDKCGNIMEVDMDQAYDKKYICQLLDYLKSEYDIYDDEIFDIEANDYTSIVDVYRKMCDLDDYFEIRLIEYQLIPKDSGMFLTYKAAEKHLKENAHHYSEDAHPYANTAWRSEEETKLFEILQTVDFKDLNKTLNAHKFMKNSH